MRRCYCERRRLQHAKHALLDGWSSDGANDRLASKAGVVLVAISVLLLLLFGEAIEMLLERIDVFGPEPAKWGQPFVEFHQRLRTQPIKPPLCFDARLDEPGVAQHAQVFGDRRLRQAQLAFDLSHRTFGIEQ